MLGGEDHTDSKDWRLLSQYAANDMCLGYWHGKIRFHYRVKRSRHSRQVLPGCEECFFISACDLALSGPRGSFQTSFAVFPFLFYFLSFFWRRMVSVSTASSRQTRESHFITHPSGLSGWTQWTGSQAWHDEHLWPFYPGLSIIT